MKKKILSLLSLMYSMCIMSQTVMPEPFKYYQIINANGLAFTRVEAEDNKPLQQVADMDDERQAFEFLPVEGEEGTYMIKAAVDNTWVCKITVDWDWDYWSIVFQEELPTAITKAKYRLEEIPGTDYIGIKNLHSNKYWGVDDGGEGTGIYCDKGMDRNSYWKLVELPTPLNKVFEKALSQLDVLYDKLDKYPGMQWNVSDFKMDMENKVLEAGDDHNAPIYLEAAQEISAFISNVEDAMKKVADFVNLFDECSYLFESQTLYPGLSELEAAYQAADEVVSSEDSGVDALISAYNTLKSAIRAYYDSQIPNATEETPAEMTYMIKAPNFRVPYAYSKDCALSSEGWVSENTGLPGEGNCFYPVHKPAEEVGEAVTCYNSWTWQFNHMNLYQDIEGLQDGWYRVECLGWTEETAVYQQHAYAISLSDSVYSNFASPEMAKWETFRTAMIPVYDGKLRIGFESESGGGAVGWFLVRDFRLFYCGALDEATLKPVFDKAVADGQAMADTMMFAADKKMLVDTMSQYESVSGAAELKQAIMVIKDAMAEAYKSVNKQNGLMAGVYKALTDSVETNVYTGKVYDMASNLVNCMKKEINSENATYTEIDSLENILKAFYDRYLPTLQTAEELEVEDAFAKSVLDDNISRQANSLIAMKMLPEETLIDAYVAELEKAMSQCEAADIILSGGTDFTGLIVNPGIDTNSNTVLPKGWNGTVVGCERFAGSGQQVDGNTAGTYFDAWNSVSGNLLFNVYQTIESIPNGRYRVSAMTRTTSEVGLYVYAFADNDSSTVALSQVELERINISEVGGPSAADGSDSILVCTDSYGSIFADLYKRTDGGETATDPELDTLLVNNGTGRGWHYTSVEIEVKDHTLTMGFTCDSTFTQKYGGVAFEGTWISADNFSLTLLSAGDNDGWNPATGISSVADEDFKVKCVNGRLSVPKGSLVYSVSGMLVDPESVLSEGIYIVKYGNRSVKVVVGRN